MRNLRLLQFWAEWGLIPRLMFAVGFAILTGGSIQTYLVVAEGAAENSARLLRDMNETMTFMAPLVADQAILGEYEAINQLLKNQVKLGETDRLEWTDRAGKEIVAQDAADKAEAPSWFLAIANINHVEGNFKVEAGGVEYGTLHAKMTPVLAGNRLWGQFVKQLQILIVTLLMMLQFIWLIFRGNLGTLRMLVEAANRFSRGDHAVRIGSEGAPEVRLAAEAFNNMADNIERLIGSLADSEARNRLLAATVAQSSEAIWTRDLNGRITSWNAGATTMFGYGADEIIGSNVIISPQLSPVEEVARIARLKLGDNFTYESKATTKDGAQIEIQCAVAPLHSDNNRVVGMICVARDVSTRNRTEAELRAARITADGASQAKSSFLARMSHEIRTPMNGVLGMTELLIESGLNATQRAFAETVQRSGKSLLGIINDILDFSKIEAGKLELEHIDFDMRQSLEDTVELLAERAQSKGLELTCALPVDLVARINGDPMRLGQVITNLVANAIKFTEKGEIVVGASCVEDAERSLKLRIQVSDTGPGINAEAQNRIFENFAQADGSTTRKYGGTGLGLAISRQLVEMMGGQLQLESVVGVGSIFWFEVRFDKAEEQTQADWILDNKVEGVRALIIEPNDTVRSILHAQISSWHIDSRTAESAEHALDLLQQAAARKAPYDVVIIAKGIGGIGALGLAQAIKSDAAIADARLIMLVPIGRHIDVREARHAGVQMCLSKPVRQSALYDCLVTVMSGAGASDTVARAAEKETPAARRFNRGRLLLAEDNVVNQQVALGILEIEGYAVTVANNGLEAVAAFSTGTFDAILMDCHMPDMDGFEATRKIREMEKLRKLERTPVIALTANAMQQDRDECLNAAMDDHLSKPYTRVQMRTTLDLWVCAKAADPALAERIPAGASPEPAATCVPVIDPAALDGLREIERSGHANLVKRVIGLYLADAPKLIGAIKQAAEADNRPDLSLAAHTLKSSSANLGALGLSNLCRQLELTARNAGGDTRQLVADVESLYGSVQTALAAEEASCAA